MDELLKILDNNLRYINHEIKENRIIVYSESIQENSICPYCKTESKKVHSRYERKFQDLPIQGKKVTLLLQRRKFFCLNEECLHKTFAERFDFFDGPGRKTKRLQSEILRISLNQSSISASEYIKHSVADVGKSTICSLLKKRRSNYGNE